MSHNWSATKQRRHLQSVAEISHHSVLSVRGQDSTMWDIVWVSPQGHRSVSVTTVIEINMLPLSQTGNQANPQCFVIGLKLCCPLVNANNVFVCVVDGSAVCVLRYGLTKLRSWTISRCSWRSRRRRRPMTRRCCLNCRHSLSTEFPPSWTKWRR